MIEGKMEALRAQAVAMQKHEMPLDLQFRIAAFARHIDRCQRAIEFQIAELERERVEIDDAMLGEA